MQRTDNCWGYDVSFFPVNSALPIQKQLAAYGAYVPNMQQLQEVVPAARDATAVTYIGPVYGAHPSDPRSFGEYDARPIAYGSCSCSVPAQSSCHRLYMRTPQRIVLKMKPQYTQH